MNWGGVEDGSTKPSDEGTLEENSEQTSGESEEKKEVQTDKEGLLENTTIPEEALAVGNPNPDESDNEDLSNEPLEEKLEEPPKTSEGFINSITQVEASITGFNEGKENATVIKPLNANWENPNEDLYLKAEFSFNIPDTTVSGDSFEVKIDDKLNLHGVGKTTDQNGLFYNGEEIATAEVQPDGRTIKYTFNENVEKIADVRLSVNIPLFIDKDNLPNSVTSEELGFNVAGVDVRKKYDISYDLKSSGTNNRGEQTLSGVSNIDEEDGEDYTHTIYVNPDKQNIKNSHIIITNSPNYKQEDGSDNDTAKFTTEVLNSVKVYRLKEDSKLNGSFSLDYDNLEDVTDKTSRSLNPDNNPTELKVDINQGWDNSSYVIVYKGKKNPEKSLGTRVYFGADNKIRENESSP